MNVYIDQLWYFLDCVVLCFFINFFYYILKRFTLVNMMNKYYYRIVISFLFHNDIKEN